MENENNIKNADQQKMVILTYTAISVLNDKIRNKFKNMVPFYHIKKR